MTSETTFTVREARAEERAAAGELTLAAYGQYAELMEPGAWAALREAILAALDAPGALAHLVVEREGALIGSVLLFPAKSGGGSGGRMIWPELRLLAVDPAARSQGCGAALAQACIERARATGAAALGLYTSDSMRSAIALYERLGFIRCPEYDFRPPGAELVMAYQLPLDAGGG